MDPKLPSTICISCSIFRSELQTLQKRGDLDIPVRFLPSMLHLDPQKLERRLSDLLEETRKSARQVLLLYGDCHPAMHDQEILPGVARIKGLNCPEILLGKDDYRNLLKEGVFFLMPEWTVRWREIFEDELGLIGDVARDLMGEMHTRLLYLDTGIMPIPEKHLRAISEYTGLSWDVIAVGGDHFLEAILSTLEEFRDEP